MLDKRLLAFVCAFVCAVVTAIALDPHVDRLILPLEMGLAGTPPTPEALQFDSDWSRLSSPFGLLAAVALMIVLTGGWPLAIVAMIARHWPAVLGPLQRSPTFLWSFMTLQLSNMVLPWLFVLAFASEGHEVVVAAAPFAGLYSSFNVMGAIVWRDRLAQLHHAELARR